MNIQIFGTKKNFDSKKAERYFKERGIKYQFIDMKEKGLSKGEFQSVCNAVGGYEKLIDSDCKDKDLLALITYIAEEDKEELTKHNNDCLSLKTIAANYDGISTSCNLNNGVSMQKQIFDYEKLDSKKVGTAYSEAGGTYPDFKKGDKISSVESKMIASGYECSKSGS